jgi:hypothetical protein
MTIRAKVTGPKKTITLVETVTGTTSHQVDRENGIIHRVKLLGKMSPNRHGRKGCEGTEYSDEAMDKACSLYEGRKAYIDHPANRNAKSERSMRDLAGTYRNVTRESDGVYADLHYPPTNSNGQMIADWAEHDPSAFGLSHNAVGTGRMRGKKQVIESIDHVRSVDVVCDPATTRGLFESRERAMKTIRESIEELGLTKQAKVLLEMDDMADATMDAPPPPPPDGGSEDAATHIGRAVLAILNDESLDASAKKKKVLAALKLMDDAPEEPATLPEPDGDEPADTVESRNELDQLRREKAARNLCESLKFTAATEVQIEAIAGLRDEKKRKDLIESFKASTPISQQRKGPRSSSSTSLLESKGSNAPAKDKASFLAAITG